ncbi:MAG TPA: RtcB family protein [Candidatus Krumholzibacteria bacterium]|nr:RtcB family protein [Candidatus Krumholzibacteria bacterium]
MDVSVLEKIHEFEWRREPTAGMTVPVVVYATEDLIREMDDKMLEQACNVATLPGIVGASYVMPDGHWGYGFPIGGVAAFDANAGGVVSAGGVGFDISCGVRCVATGLKIDCIRAVQETLADALFAHIPAGVGSHGKIHLDDAGMEAMLRGGAHWAVERGWGTPADLDRIEENGRASGALPDAVSARAQERQRGEMGTLGSGNHYLEVQRVAEVFAEDAAAAFGLAVDDAVVSIHCGSRGMGHQIGTDYLREMERAAPRHGLRLPDRELACAPLRSDLARRYLGAMRAGINCALANRQILTHLTRGVLADILPDAVLDLVYDVSHNTCKEEEHGVDGRKRPLFVHRKGATRAFGPGHAELPAAFQDAGQPVLIGGTMGTESWVLAGTRGAMQLSFGSACHGAGRRMSRHQATRQWNGRDVVRELGRRGITIRAAGIRGVAEEAPGAYKDVAAVVDAAHRAGLARKVARLEPVICVKG